MTIEEQLSELRDHVQTHELVLQAMLLAVTEILTGYPQHRQKIRATMMQVVDMALMNQHATDTAINQSRELIALALRDLPASRDGTQP